MNLKYLFFIFVMSFLLFSLYPIPYTLYPTFAQSPACSPQATNPRVQNGLISASDISGSSNKFANQSGTCAIDQSKIRFAPFKIPTYDDLKSLYFTQSKAPKVTNTSTNLASVAEGTVYSYTHTTSDINSGNYNYSATAIIFIDGSIYINGDIKTTDLSKGLVLVVKNNVNIDRSVKQIDAVIIAQGPIYTAGTGCATNTVNVGTDSLTINGSLISLTDSGSVKFCRVLSDNSQPAEKVVYQPKYLVILRDIFSETYQKWSEIQ